MTAPEPNWFVDDRGYRPHAEPGELYDLGADLAERDNRYATRLDLVEAMRRRLDEIRHP